MFTDSNITAELRSMVSAVDVPSVPLAQIRERMAHAELPATDRRENRLAVAAAIAAAALLSVVPLVSPAVMQGIEARYRAALQALGGIAPPPAPKTLVSRLKSQSVTLAQAQSRVRFTIVSPAGLPNDVVASSIAVTPTGVYSKQGRSWSVGPNEVTFRYRRANGREFVIIADRYDLHGEPLGKYVFEARDPGPSGRPVLTKHEVFAWRNGDQLMHVVDGPQITAREIAAIQTAMHGTPVALRNLHSPDNSPTNTLRVLRHP